MCFEDGADISTAVDPAGAESVHTSIHPAQTTIDVKRSSPIFPSNDVSFTPLQHHVGAHTSATDQKSPFVLSSDLNTPVFLKS